MLRKGRGRSSDSSQMAIGTLAMLLGFQACLFLPVMGVRLLTLHAQDKGIQRSLDRGCLIKLISVYAATNWYYDAKGLPHSIIFAESINE